MAVAQESPSSPCRRPIFRALARRSSKPHAAGARSGGWPQTRCRCRFCPACCGRPGASTARTGPYGQPGRTAASASNSQEIDLYVLLESGAYRYSGHRHRLKLVLAEDIRADALTPGQRMRTDVSIAAPAQLVFVADVEKLIHTRGFAEPGLNDPETQKSYFFVDAGLIAGNVIVRGGGGARRLVSQLRQECAGGEARLEARATRVVRPVGRFSRVKARQGRRHCEVKRRSNPWRRAPPYDLWIASSLRSSR